MARRVAGDLAAGGAGGGTVTGPLRRVVGGLPGPGGRGRKNSRWWRRRPTTVPATGRPSTTECETSVSTPQHARPAASPTVSRSVARDHLSRLAGELAQYGVWARVFEDEGPYLRVSDPESVYATEDIHCERQAHRHVYRAGFGVDLGSTDRLADAARQVAWLVGRATRPASAASGPAGDRRG